VVRWRGGLRVPWAARAVGYGRWISSDPIPSDDGTSVDLAAGVDGLPHAGRRATEDDRPGLDDWLAALAISQQRLASVLANLTLEDLLAPSFASQWSCAQVLSHLGSGAEIFGLLLAAGLRGEDPPGGEDFAQVWARWDARTPHEQVTESMRVNDEFLATVRALDPVSRRRWQLPLYGAPGDLSDLIYLRLGEHALHTWDVEVVRASAAEVTAPAVALLTGRLDVFATRVARPGAGSLDTLIVTERPPGGFRVVATSSSVEVTAVDLGEARPETARIHLPAELWLRLVYGRARHDELGELGADSDTVRALTALFPGF
jgi:uncharacterized protein (TIGR03083 family)